MRLFVCDCSSPQGRIVNFQHALTYARMPTLGFEIPAPQADQRAKKVRRLEEGIRINC
jgi:hypothetical protein